MSPDDPRKRLIEAAGQIFGEKGFKGGTVREISQRAGVNLAAVNYYFRDKEGLYVEAVKASCCLPPLAGPSDWPPGTPPETKLAEFIRSAVTHILDTNRPTWHRYLMMQEMIHPTPCCAEVVASVIRPRAEVLEGILRELLPHESQNKRRLVAFSIVGQYLFYRFHETIVANLVGEDEYRTWNPDHLAEHILHFSLAALGLRPPVGSATTEESAL
jgi:AcrR family transcriptional regulator